MATVKSKRTRDEVVEDLKRQLDQWNERLDALEERVQETRGEARAEASQRVNALKERRKEYENRLKQLEEAGEDAWSELRRGAEDAWSEMSDALQRARERFAEEEKNAA